MAHSPSHAQSQENAIDGQIRDPLGQAAGRGEHRVNENAAHERPSAADAIGENPEEHSPDRRREQSRGSKQAACGRAHSELPHQVGEHHRVKHDVHAVEHPPQ